MAAAETTKGHPPALYLLFTTEMWERMSYYGMRALLVLYMVDATRGGFAWDSSKALQIYGVYTGLVYMTPLIGGWIADQYIGQRKAIVLGGVLMMIGHFLMAVPGETAFYSALGFLVIGNGFFKPNISTLVGALYKPGDSRRDGAFTIFYMGINIGAFFSPLVCGTLGERVGWHWGFGAAGVGMGVGLLVFLALQKRLLGDIGLAPTGVKNAAGETTKAPAQPLKRFEIDRLLVIGIFLLFSVFFWAAFEQAGGLMNLYTDSKVDRILGGWEIPTSWFQSINAAFIVMLAPVFAMLWTRLGKSGKNPNSAAKMGLGVIGVGLAFALMLGASSQAETAGKANMMWIVGFYLLCTIGELCLSPVGLSAVTKLAPSRYGSLMMGAWFASSGLANYASGVIGSFSNKLGEGQLFAILAGVCVTAGTLLLILSPKVKKLMHGAEDTHPMESEDAPKPALATS